MRTRFSCTKTILALAALEITGPATACIWDPYTEISVEISGVADGAILCVDTTSVSATCSASDIDRLTGLGSPQYDWDTISSYTWTVSRGSVNPTTGTSVTWTLPSTPSSSVNGDWIKVTVSDLPKSPAPYGGTRDDPNKAHTHYVTLCQIQQDYDLWWFNGANAANYFEQVTLTAVPLSTGSFKWDVTSGTATVNFENDQDSITKTNINTVGVKSMGFTASPNGVSIQLTYSGSALCTHAMTVFSPDFAYRWGTYDTSHDSLGYWTYIHYYIWDQFGNILPYNVEANEYWSTAVEDDWAGNDWQRVDPSGGMTIPWDFADNISGESKARNPNPMPVSPTDPAAGEKVHHWGQQFCVGSTTPGLGRLVKTHTLQRYRGKGRHE